MAQVTVEPQFDSSLMGQRDTRLGKIEKLKTLGFDPYPAKGNRTHDNREIEEKYEELEGSIVTVVGRIMSFREHGAIIFSNIQDTSGAIQLYIRQDEMEPVSVKAGNLGWENLNLLDVGDFIEASGPVTKTQRGQISVAPKAIRLLAKSIRPLPDKWQGLKDKEERYRRRYLDMTMNKEVRDRFIRRSRFWDAIRDFLNSNGFVEVNIPVLEHVTGGADAKPFITHYDALDQDFYLRISHELPLKRLLGAGFEKVYDIGPRFRNEGFSDEHLPEHIAMEWYWAYADYRDGMKLTEEMFKYVLKEVYGTLQFHIKGFDVDLDQEWKEIKYVEIIKERFGVDVFNDSVEDMNRVLKENGVDLGCETNRNRVVDNLWKLIRKTIAGPVFLTGVPKFLSPLSKTNSEDSTLTDRFHPVIAGSELANAFSELNDPVDQLDRFVEQQKLREQGDEEAHMMDIDFVEMLEYGMPPACGFGLSERVFWFFEDVSAKEGVPFPQLRLEYDNSTKEIYGEIWKYVEEEKNDSKEDGNENKETDRKPHKDTKTQDLSKKIVLVLNKELSGWQLTNTVGHLSTYIGNQIDQLRSRPAFLDKDGNSIPSNSQYPIITRSANPGQMYNLLIKIEEAGLPHLAFTQEMIDHNIDDDVQSSIGEKNKRDLNYLGIGFFGPIEQIDQLTKKFSLWNS